MNAIDRLAILEKKVHVLEDLEKRLALAVLDVMPTTVNNVSGYEISTILTARGTRYVWKHFLRGGRSPATFETREACVKSAQADALRHLAYPTKDMDHFINKEQHASGTSGSPAHRLKQVLGARRAERAG